MVCREVVCSQGMLGRLEGQVDAQPSVHVVHAVAVVAVVTAATVGGGPLLWLQARDHDRGVGAHCGLTGHHVHDLHTPALLAREYDSGCLGLA